MEIRPSAKQLRRAEGERALLLVLLALAAAFPPTARLGVVVLVILGVAAYEVELVVAFNRQRIQIDDRTLRFRGTTGRTKSWPRESVGRILVGGPMPSLLPNMRWQIEFESTTSEVLVRLDPSLWSADEVVRIADELGAGIEEGTARLPRTFVGHAWRFAAAAAGLTLLVALAVVVVVSLVLLRGS